MFDAAVWTFVCIMSAYPPYMSASYYSPLYPTQASCEAAREGLLEFEGPTPEACTNDPFVVEGQWLDKIAREYREAELGGPW